mgnify:CR=1 FL=1
MEQIQRSKTDTFSDKNTNGLLFGLLAFFALMAVLTAYLIFTRVRDFVATWNITDLPGMVVERNASATPDVLEGVPAGVNPQPGAVNTGPEPIPWDGASRVNVLIMGLDYRDWESGEGAPRTDTMILFSVDPISMTAGILSIPRDLWVSIPGFEEPNRINVAYRFGETYQLPGGGAALAMKTVEGLIGLKIDYYALIDFYSFEKFIDEIGGIEVKVPRNIFVDPIDGPTVKLKKGENLLPGSLALAYARARNTEGGDFDRAERQQQVIMAIRERILSAELLPVLVSRAPVLYEQLASGVQTNLTLDQAIRLAWLAAQIPAENIKRGAINNEHIRFYTSPDGDQVLKPRPEQIRILRDELFTASGPVSPTTANADLPDLVKAENARLSILNGAGTPGLATRTADHLAQLGMNVTSTGDAPEPYSVTTLISYSGKPYTLRYLVETMGIPNLRIYNRYDPANPVDIVIYLGYDWANTNTMP